MAMEECPHCGEPIDEKAKSCPHCGADDETGWKPDTDYWSVELPEDDAEDGEPAPTPWSARLPATVGPVVPVAAWIFFVIYGSSRFRPPFLVLIPAIYLVIVISLAGWIARRIPRNQGN